MSVADYAKKAHKYFKINIDKAYVLGYNIKAVKLICCYSSVGRVHPW